MLLLKSFAVRGLLFVILAAFTGCGGIDLHRIHKRSTLLTTTRDAPKEYEKFLGDDFFDGETAVEETGGYKDSMLAKLPPNVTDAWKKIPSEVRDVFDLSDVEPMELWRRVFTLQDAKLQATESTDFQNLKMLIEDPKQRMGKFPLELLELCKPEVLQGLVANMSRENKMYFAEKLMSAGTDKDRVQNIAQNLNFTNLQTLITTVGATLMGDSYLKQLIEDNELDKMEEKWSSGSMGTIIGQDMPDLSDDVGMDRLGISDINRMPLASVLNYRNKSGDECLRSNEMERMFRDRLCKESPAGVEIFPACPCFNKLIAKQPAEVLQEIRCAGTVDFSRLTEPQQEQICRRLADVSMTEGSGDQSVPKACSTYGSEMMCMVYNVPKIKNLTNSEMLNKVLPAVKTRELGHRKMRQFAERLFKTPEYAPENLTLAAIKGISNMLRGIGKSEVERMPKSVVQEVITDNQLAEVELPKCVARQFFRKYKESLNGQIQWSASNVLKFGKNLVRLGYTDLETISDAVTHDRTVLGKLKEWYSDMTPQMRMLFYKKIISDQSVTCKLLGPFIKEMPNDQLWTKCRTEVESNVALTDINPRIASRLFSEVKETKGLPGPQNLRFGEEEIKNVQSIVGGLNVEDIRNMSSSPKYILRLIDSLRSNPAAWRPGTVEALAKKLIVSLRLFSTNLDVKREHARFFTRTNIRRIAPLIMYLPVEILKELPPSSKAFIVEKIIDSNLCGVSKANIEILVKFILECKGASIGELPHKVIKELGRNRIILANLPTERMKNVGVEDIPDFARALQFQPDAAAIKEFIGVLKLKKNVAKLDGKLLTLLGKLAVYVDLSTDVGAITNEYLCGAMGNIADAVREAEEKFEERKECGPQDMSDTEEAAYKVKKKAFFKRLLEACMSISNSEQSSPGNEGPRTLTCEDLQAGGEVAIQSLNATTASQLPPEEFKKCMCEIGEVEDMATDVKRSLLTVAKLDESLGPVENWDSSDIEDVKKLIPAMSEDDFKKMTITEGAMTDIAQIDFEESDVKDELCTKARTVLSISNMASMTSDKLTKLGNLVACLTGTEISQLTDTVVKETLPLLGAMKITNSTVARATFEKMKTAIGGVEQMTSSDIEAAGNLMASINSEEMKQLAENQFQAIDNTAIKGMSSDVVDVIANEKASFLTADQQVATEVVQDQQQGGNNNQSGGGGSGSAEVKYSLSALVLMLTLSLCI